VTQSQAEKALSKLSADFGNQAWFSALGETPSSSEEETARHYLSGLSLPDTPIRWVRSLADAEQIIHRTDWSKKWWAAEEAVITSLTDQCNVLLGQAHATALLNRLMSDASVLLTGPAASAAAQAGIADPGLHRAMAGAAVQACYGIGLVVGTQSDTVTAPAAQKYSLFAGGRWPLALVEGAYHIL
jgi:hypothetical protein